jgi:hypothetical protein
LNRASSTTTETELVINAGNPSPFDTVPPALPEAPVAPGLLLAVCATIVLGTGTVIVVRHQRRDTGE